MDEVIHQHRYAGCEAWRGLDKNDDLIGFVTLAGMLCY
jgi:hypothetical protein